MIKATNTTFKYPNSDKIVFPDFSVANGAGLLITGESGCGKTTLLHILAGLRKPLSGEIIIDNQDITQLPSSKLDQFRGQHIGIVYQQPYFIESLSIMDNLILSPFTSDKKKVIKIAKRLNIGELLHRLPSQLSVGQKQRASIARAVMNQPKLILADEPTSALDNKNSRQVTSLLAEEAKANNAALIVVTHDDRVRSEFSSIINLEPIPKTV